MLEPKTKKEKKPLDWKDLGRFNSTLLDLFGTARDKMAGMGIGLEIVGWLANGGQWEFVKFLENLGREYKSAHEPIKAKTPVIPTIIDFAKLAEFALSGTVPAGMSIEDIIRRCRIPKWTIAPNGVIYLALPPTKGWKEEWIDYFQQEGHDPSEYAKSVIRSKEFQPTTGIIHHIAILPAKLWPDSDRITRRMRQDATAGVFTPGQNLTDPNAEVGCLIRDFLTDEEIKALGLGRIVTMHPPILDFDGSPSLLAAFRDGDGSYLSAYGDDPDAQWGDAGGFVWSVPQVSA